VKDLSAGCAFAVVGAEFIAARAVAQ